MGLKLLFAELIQLKIKRNAKKDSLKIQKITIIYRI